MHIANAPQLITDRLLLRPPEEADLSGFIAFGAEVNTMRFLGGRPLSRAEAWRRACGLAGAWMIRGYGMFSVIERATGTWIGRVGPHYPEDWPAREVGWGILEAYTGRGYAAEAATAAIDYAFDELGWDRVSHVIDPANAPSIRLAKRLGSTRIAGTKLPAPYEGFEVDLYGQTRSTWLARTEKSTAGPG